MLKFIILLIMLATPPLDATRDAWLNSRYRKVSWWKWHLVKWAAFYPPLGVLGFQYFLWQEMALLAFMGLISWKIFYSYFTHKLKGESS